MYLVSPHDTFRAPRFLSRCGAVAAVAILLVSGIASTVCARADTKADTKVDGVSTPQVSIDIEAYAPSGAMRLYSMPNGSSYWTSDLPIYRGDTVKIDVFVATGADELQHLKVRIDNVPVADLTKAPWTTSLPATTLGLGYHFVEAWVQVSGPKPRFATHSMEFMVADPPSATVSQPTALVMGQEQILSQGQVVTVPLDANAMADPATAPPLPAFLSTAKPDPKAAVSIVLTDPEKNTTLDQKTAVQTSSPIVAIVAPTAHSTAQQFTYMLERGSQTVVPATRLFPADSVHIRLQPRTSKTPGLLPGLTTIWVWGVDSDGNYGPPVSATVQLQPPVGV
jgi:hypothetical protein